MTRPVLEFWYDFASTYSYLSAMRIDRLAGDAGIEIAWMPFLLGPIFKAQGWTSSPFNIYPAKGRYMVGDMERLAEARALQFKLPSPFPQNSLAAARLSLAIDDPVLRAALTRKIYSAEFQESADISDPAVLARALAGAASETALAVDNAGVIAAAASDRIKAILRRQTEAAAAAGIFGAPTFRTADGELFWGDDRLPDAIDWARRL